MKRNFATRINLGKSNTEKNKSLQVRVTTAYMYMAAPIQSISILVSTHTRKQSQTHGIIKYLHESCCALHYKIFH